MNAPGRSIPSISSSAQEKISSGRKLLLSPAQRGESDSTPSAPTTIAARSSYSAPVARSFTRDAADAAVLAEEPHRLVAGPQLRAGRDGRLGETPVEELAVDDEPDARHLALEPAPVRRDDERRR